MAPRTCGAKQSPSELRIPKTGMRGMTCEACKAQLDKLLPSALAPPLIP